MRRADAPTRPALRWHGKRSFREPGDLNRFNLSRFLVDSNTGCHIWQGALNDKGYAIVGTNRDGTFRAARLVYMRDKGTLNPGEYPDHLCRNRSCINSAHLEKVSNAENTRRGSRAKLTMELAEEIRRLRSEGRLSERALGKRFGVHQTTIHDLLKRGRWSL